MLKHLVTQLIKGLHATNFNAMGAKALIGGGVEVLHGTPTIDVDKHACTLGHICSVCIKYLIHWWVCMYWWVCIFVLY